MSDTVFTTHLIVSWPPNNTGLPADVNPAYNPLVELIQTKLSAMHNEKRFGRILPGASGVNTLEFIDTVAATEYQTYLTEVLIDLNQGLPEFTMQPAPSP